MNYFIDLFSPETAKAFEQSPQDVSGFRISRKTYVENIKLGPGDKFICYVTRLQRFIGVLEVTSKYFIDETPIFTAEKDPFILRFKVKPLVWLPLEKAIPIYQENIWNKLSFTKNLGKSNPNAWTYMVFSSPRQWPKEDCEHLEKLLVEQSNNLVDYPLSDEDQKKLKVHKIKLNGRKEVEVSVPDNEEEVKFTQPESLNEKRESLKIQAKLAELGEIFGMKVWLPRNDRVNILDLWQPKENTLLEELPFPFDEIVMKTIKNIDVLWIKGRAPVRAFEVEGTTSIYSGILRMADLLSMLPSLKINIHLVAPQSRKEEVFKQISRPVFSVMESGPLSELCSYISYDSVYELSKQPNLKYMTDSKIIDDEYAEFLEE